MTLLLLAFLALQCCGECVVLDNKLRIRTISQLAYEKY